MPKLREWLTKDRALWLAITIGVLLNVVTLWNAALAHRPLFLDGAVWMFRIFSFGKVVYDPDYTRYLDTLLQLPGIWWIRAYGTTEDVTRTAMHLIELAYSLHPFLSLLACAAILRKKGRIELLIFPLLSFALVTQTTMAFHIGVVPDALSCFWPLFLLVILQEGRQDLPAIAALSLALAFTYELAFLFFFFLAAVTAVRLLTERKGDRTLQITLGISIACVLWLLYRSFGPHVGYSGNFSKSLKQAWGAYRIYAAAATLGFSIFGALVVYKPVHARRWTLGMVIVFAIAAMDYLKRVAPDPVAHSSIWMAYDGRTLAIPMAIILAACAAFLQWRDPQGQWGRTIFYPVAQGVLAVALVLSAANDQSTTRNWNMGTWNLSRMTPAQGCNAVPQNMTGYLQPYGIYPWAEPHLSIMLQESRSIHGIAIDQGFADYIGVHDPCARVKQGFLPENNLNHEVPLRGNRYFDFSTVLK